MGSGADKGREIELTGGNTSRVTRIDDTVRRSAGRWTASVHELLRYLESVGFDGVPRVAGFDEKGREILSFLHGEVPVDRPWPEFVWSDAALRDVGRWLARYHLVVLEFPPQPEPRWWSFEGNPQEGEIICHNDFGPYNAVFREGRLAGVIDWDVAGPAKPLWDLAFCAWSWVPLHHPELVRALGGPGEESQAARLEILCEAYGYHDPAGLLSVVVDRVISSRDGIRDGAEAGDPVMQRLVNGGHLTDMEQTLEYLRARRASIIDEIRHNSLL